METVTRLRATTSGTDDFGQPIPGPDDETDLPDALFAPSSSAEVWTEVGRVPVITQATVYFPGSWPDVVSTDRLRVRGTVFAVDGVPADWRMDDGPGGLVVTLKDAEG